MGGRLSRERVPLLQRRDEDRLPEVVTRAEEITSFLQCYCDDLLGAVFQFLSVAEISSARLVSRHWDGALFNVAQLPLRLSELETIKSVLEHDHIRVLHSIYIYLREARDNPGMLLQIGDICFADAAILMQDSVIPFPFSNFLTTTIAGSDHDIKAVGTALNRAMETESRNRFVNCYRWLLPNITSLIKAKNNKTMGYILFLVTMCISVGIVLIMMLPDFIAAQSRQYKAGYIVPAANLNIDEPPFIGCNDCDYGMVACGNFSTWRSWKEESIRNQLFCNFTNMTVVLEFLFETCQSIVKMCTGIKNAMKHDYFNCLLQTVNRTENNCGAPLINISGCRASFYGTCVLTTAQTDSGYYTPVALFQFIFLGISAGLIGLGLYCRYGDAFVEKLFGKVIKVNNDKRIVKEVANLLMWGNNRNTENTDPRSASVVAP